MSAFQTHHLFIAAVKTNGVKVKHSKPLVKIDSHIEYIFTKNGLLISIFSKSSIIMGMATKNIIIFNSNKCRWYKYKTFNSWKCIWKCRLRNRCQFVQGDLSKLYISGACTLLVGTCPLLRHFECFNKANHKVRLLKQHETNVVTWMD